MVNPQIELNNKLGAYIKEPEYYLSTMLGRFGEQDFNNPYYSSNDLVTFLSQVFLVKNSVDGHRVVKYDISKVKFYKSVYIPSKDDEVLAEEQLKIVNARLKERDRRVVSNIIQSIEVVARRIVEEEVVTEIVTNASRKISIYTYARKVLCDLLEVLETDLDVTPEGLEQIQRINLILDGEEI
jgi:hypothetical protein